MAKFNTTGLEEVERQLLLQGEAAIKAAPLMLEAGAAVLIEAQKAAASRLNISGRSKGALVASIKAGKMKSTSNSRMVEVYPHGTDKRHTKAGVRNAEKAFVLEHGRKGMPATNWLSKANAACADAVIAAQLRVWEGMRNGGG